MHSVRRQLLFTEQLPKPWLNLPLATLATAATIQASKMRKTLWQRGRQRSLKRRLPPHARPAPSAARESVCPGEPPAKHRQQYWCCHGSCFLQMSMHTTSGLLRLPHLAQRRRPAEMLLPWHIFNRVGGPLAMSVHNPCCLLTVLHAWRSFANP